MEFTRGSITPSRLPGIVPVSRASRMGAVAAAAALGLLAAAGTVIATRALLRRTRLAREGAHERGLDPLTGLPNQAQTHWWIDQAWHQARLNGQRLAVLTVDISDFSTCTQTYGREAGDHVLQVTGVRIQAQMRAQDVVGRVGPDVFTAVIQVNGPDHQVTVVGERIARAIAEPITFGSASIGIGAHIGFAVSVPRETDSALLIGRAERAVEQAKASRRVIVQF